MKKKVMISQSMTGLTKDQFVETQNRFLKFVESRDFEGVDTLFTDEWYSQESLAERGIVHAPLYVLAKVVDRMSLCQGVYFAEGWESDRQCVTEHQIALAYGLEIIYEDTINTTHEDI